MLLAMVLLHAAVWLAAPGEAGLLGVEASWQEVAGVRGVRVMPAGGGAALIEPNGQAMLTPTKCTARLELKQAGGGFDLLVTVTNPTDQPQDRPTVHLTGIRFGRKTVHLDARSLGTVHERDATGKTSMWSPRLTYPDDLYAPVLMIRDDRFAMGASLLYDVLACKHGMSTFWGAEGGQFTGTYRVHVGLGVQGARHPANRVAPGATQTYRLAVRFAKPARWLDTLEPYRQFFRNRYGRVRYQADRRPVWGQPLSQGEYMKPADPANPRGYSPQWRTDRDGWKKTVDWIFENVIPKGYRRIMLWNPQGLYRVGANFPCEFMTEWSKPMVETAGELKRFGRAGVTVGMWWGRASQVSGGFNTGKMWARDIRNPRDVEAGDRELRLAATCGADEIGLDAYNAIGLCDRRAWMLRIRKRYPTLRFITEAADCDIMHTLAPTYCTWQRQPQPPVLADWLNPGHETWVQLRWQDVNPERFGQLRRWGLVPVTMSRTVPHAAAAATRPSP